jgi:hypothetical protein
MSWRPSKRRTSCQESDKADLCIEIRVKEIEKNRKSDDDANGRDQFRGASDADKAKMRL